MEQSAFTCEIGAISRTARKESYGVGVVVWCGFSPKVISFTGESQCCLPSICRRREETKKSGSRRNICETLYLYHTVVIFSISTTTVCHLM
jgi:hypothetical protein